MPKSSPYRHRIVAAFLVLWVLASGFQLGISKHYCCGSLKDMSVSFFGELPSCCCVGREAESLRKGCCENTVVYLQQDHQFLPDYSVAAPIIFDLDLIAIPTVPRSELIMAPIQRYFTWSHAPPDFDYSALHRLLGRYLI